jgi:ubiquinone biosynthesis protein COQ9
MALTIRHLKPLATPRTLRTLQLAACNATPSNRKQCFYHSYDHPPAPAYPPPETAILTSALKHIPTHGFTKEALTRGAIDAGYLPISTNLFPRGAFELVAFWCVRAREELKGVVDGGVEVEEDVRGREGGLRKSWDDGKIGVGGRVRSLVLERLRMNVESGVVGKWQEVRYILSIAVHLHIPLELVSKNAF